MTDDDDDNGQCSCCAARWVAGDIPEEAIPRAVRDGLCAECYAIANNLLLPIPPDPKETKH